MSAQSRSRISVAVFIAAATLLPVPAASAEPPEATCAEGLIFDIELERCVAPPESTPEVIVAPDPTPEPTPELMPEPTPEVTSETTPEVMVLPEPTPEVTRTPEPDTEQLSELTEEAPAEPVVTQEHQAQPETTEPETTEPETTQPETTEPESTEPETTEPETTEPEAPESSTFEPEGTGLSITAGAVAARGQLRAGESFAATIPVEVIDDRTESVGWTVLVTMSEFRGLHTSARLLPVNVFYTAPSTDCASSLGRQSIRGAETAVMRANERCSTRWSADLDIELPPEGMESDTYTAVVTHSIA